MHNVVHLTFTSKDSEHKILKECQRIANEDGDYPDQIQRIRFSDRVMPNRKSAIDWIENNDSGWYDNLSVRYKEGRRINRLVKIEYHS